MYQRQKINFNQDLSEVKMYQRQKIYIIQDLSKLNIGSDYFFHHFRVTEIALPC